MVERLCRRVWSLRLPRPAASGRENAATSRTAPPLLAVPQYRATGFDTLPHREYVGGDNFFINDADWSTSHDPHAHPGRQVLVRSLDHRLQRLRPVRRPDP